MEKERCNNPPFYNVVSGKYYIEAKYSKKSADKKIKVSKELVIFSDNMLYKA